MPSDDIARIVPAFQTNTTIKSTDMNPELDQLVNVMNTKFGRGVSQTLTGNNIFTGNNTFTGSNTFSGSTPFSNLNLATALDPTAVDGSEWYNSTTKVFKAKEQGLIVTAGIVAGINEQSGATYTALATDRGMTVVHNSAVSVVHTLPQAGTTGFTDKFRYTVANIGIGYVVITPQVSMIDNGTLLLLPPGQSVTLQSNDTNYFTEKGLSSYPTGYHGSAPAVYASASTITFQYIRERDSTDSVNIVQNTPLTVNGANLGLNGLDAGTTGDNQWIYFYAVTNGVQSGVMASLINEWVTGSISGVNFAYTYKRQLKFAIPTDGSGNILPFSVIRGDDPLVLYTCNIEYAGGPVGPTVLLFGGSATSSTPIDASPFIPPFSTIGVFAQSNNGGTDVQLQQNGGGNGFLYLTNGRGDITVTTDSTQKIAYAFGSGGGSLGISVRGFYVNQDF